MKRPKFKRLRPMPLPADPDLLDRLEYAMQWLISWFVVDIEGHPTVSGMLTGLLLSVPTLCVATVICWLFGIATSK